MAEDFIKNEFSDVYEQIFNMLATAKTLKGITPSARRFGHDVKSINERLNSFRQHGLPENKTTYS